MKRFLSKAGVGLTLSVIALGNLASKAGAQTLEEVIRPEGVRADAEWMDLIPQIINLVFIVAAALTFFYLIAGAIKWITSGGDKGKVEEARNRITAAVIGLLILAATWAIFTLIMQIAFGGTDVLKVPDFSGTGGSSGVSTSVTCRNGTATWTCPSGKSCEMPPRTNEVGTCI